MQTPLYLVGKEWGLKEKFSRQPIWASSLLSQRPSSCSPVKARKWWKGHWGSSATASGPSVLIPYLSGSSHTFPSPAGRLKTGATEHRVYCFLCFLDISKHPSRLFLFVWFLLGGVCFYLFFKMAFLIRLYHPERSKEVTWYFIQRRLGTKTEET